MISLLLVLFSILSTCYGANILFVAPFFGGSHVAFVQSVALHMASRGHNITVITYSTVADPPKNYRQIRVDKSPLIDQYGDVPFEMRRNMSALDELQLMWTLPLVGIQASLNTAAVKRLIASDEERFDLVISEMFYHEALYPLAYKYDAPHAILGTTTLLHHGANMMGNPLPLNYVQFEQYKGGEMDTLWMRVANALLCAYERTFRRWSYLPKMDAIAREHFGSHVPAIEDLERNVSLLLVNTHFSYDDVVPLVPGVVQVAGAHFKPMKPLPDDLRMFLDDATEGVILFAFGTHLHLNTMGADRVKSFVEAFTALKQKVVWKWDGDEPPPAKNIIYRNWIPQFDLLGHPNVKLFIGHGGMLSIQEAVHHAVPMIGIPLFYDQYRNVKMLVRRGIGVELDFNRIDNTTVTDALNKILKDPAYARRMKSVSSKFRDRQNPPLDTAAYWLEYIIKHRDPRGLKTPLADMNFFDYYSIEILTFLLLSFTTVVIFYIFKLSLRLCLKKYAAKVQNTQSKRKHKKA